jgi:hypothetical protein
MPLLIGAVPEVISFDEIIPRFKLFFHENLSFYTMNESLL